MQEILLNIVPSALLMLVAGWAALKTTLDSLFASENGTIITRSEEPYVRSSEIACPSGRPSAVVLVRLSDQQVVEAEIGPCTACIERLKEGDAVTITRLGGRVIAQRGSAWANLR